MNFSMKWMTNKKIRKMIFRCFKYHSFTLEIRVGLGKVPVRSFLIFSYLMTKHEFKDNHRELIVELIRWYWNNYPKVIWMGVDNSDYEFLYSLWKNTVSKYDDKIVGD